MADNAIDRVRAYVEAVPTMYDDDDPMPEGLILDTATDYSRQTLPEGFKYVKTHPECDLTLADLCDVLALAEAAEQVHVQHATQHQQEARK